MSGLRRIVVCSLEEWDEVWRRNQFLADRLLRRYPEVRILFVEPPADPLHDLNRRSRPKLPRLRAVDGERRLQALRPLKPLPRRAGRLADASLRAQVRTAARLLGFERPVLWLNDVTYAPLIQQTRWPTLYDVTDDWLLAPVPERERDRLRRLDGLALRDAAEVVVCSPALAGSRGLVRPVTLLPNAVDVEHFRRPRDRPEDLPPGPVAAYVGTLHESRLDVELVSELARALEPVAVALVGPDSLSAGSRSSLGALPNVHLLGPRAYEDVPAYLQHADVIVVPHRVTEFTESLDPIKAYECLAVGRPTVATPVAGFRGLGPPVVVAGRESFVATVRAALDGRDAGAPGPSPEVPSWDERAQEFAGILERVSLSG